MQSDQSYLYLSLRVSLWWEAARGVIDAVIITNNKGSLDRTLPPATGRSIVNLARQQTHTQVVESMLRKFNVDTIHS